MKNIMYFKRFTLLMAATLSIFSTSAMSDETEQRRKLVQDLAAQYVASAIEHSAAESLTTQTMPIDNRIDIPLCPTSMVPAAGSNALQQSNVTVKISCPANDWYLYVMVKVMHTQPVVVAVSALSPGSIITENDLQVINMDKNRLRKSTFADIDSVVGARSKRRLRSGQPVSPEQLCFVCEGDAITIRANIGGIEVKTTGTAMEDGVIGEQILVQNSRSERTLMGQVTSHSDVTVNL